MSPANTAQREPSMEEILASIRRIIEDSDTDKKPESEPFTAAIGNPANDVAETPRAIEAFRAELREVEPEPVQAVSPTVVEPPRPHAAPTVTLADIQAQLASEQDADVVVTAVETEMPDVAAMESHVAPTELSAVDPTSEAEQDAQIADAFANLDLMQEIAEQPEIADITETPEAAVGTIAELQRTPIVSEFAGRQVAAAFGELSEAFAASRRRSFDEMAEEMLRPMLQDWLDNNLPHLVEKLVREEIERIARGS